MRLTLAAIGRWKAGPMKALYDDFAGRLTGAPLGPLTLRELEIKGRFPLAERRRREGVALTALRPAGVPLIALDARGKALPSRGFAELLGQWRDDGLGEIVFVIGGAEGLSPEVRAAAERVISLGPATWPHLLVRVLLAEQLFRAQCILTGHPYHRD
jgi:23S rRNA (pseudouridine1915-N3)-methyltransferase